MLVLKLSIHIPTHSLPRTLGGQLDSNHSAWLSHCHQILSATDLWGSFTDDTIPFDQFSVSNQILQSTVLNYVFHVSTYFHCLQDSNDTSIEDNSVGPDGVANGLSKKMRRNGTSTSNKMHSCTLFSCTCQNRFLIIFAFFTIYLSDAFFDIMYLYSVYLLICLFFIN